jgi:hypothetical protein
MIAGAPLRRGRPSIVGLLGAGVTLVSMGAVALIALGIIHVARQPDPGSITVAAATEVLRRAEGFALASDLAGVCTMASSPSSCNAAIRDAGGARAAPRTRATKAGSRIVPTQRRSGHKATGGRMLVVAGVDGLGRSYTSEFLVFYDGSRLAPLPPVYWSGMQLLDENTPDGAPAQ